MQAFLKSNQDLALKMSEMQTAQLGSPPSASGIGDLRRELDEANEERVQVDPPLPPPPVSSLHLKNINF